jgi:glutamyl-tRNA synthetase
MQPQPTTRLAPSPTGALHLGNARTFLLNWLLARQRGWRVLMRVEDLDGPRVKAGADAQLLDELAWLGLSWQRPVVYQSQRGQLYQQALANLADAGVAYPCICSRKDIELAAGAPHAEDAMGAYPGTCRGRFASAAAAAAASQAPPAWRVATDGEAIEFVDEIAGPQRFELAQAGGDFVIFKRDGLAAYQLAVVLDDAAAGVDCIVRGDDLLDSAARQIHLRRLLGIGPEPRYWHLPLVVGPDGRRLAKRHGDTRLEHYRRLGCESERVLGLLGYWSGLIDRRRPATMDELLDRFDLDKLPRRPVVFGPADDAFLGGQ